ncbi:hypothetical protein KAR91_04885 [Candidatus Pacearchaeota archaeon]|nr:hypothetical protein [Candidatus Pacearchaeota archaeon]
MMGLKPIFVTKQFNYESTVEFLLALLDNVTNLPVASQTPDIYVRRASDGFFFDGAVFVDTSGVPTALALTEIGTSAPGLYLYSYVDPGPVVPTPPTLQLTRDKYQFRYVNTGSPAGETWEVVEFLRELRDINTQGS